MGVPAWAEAHVSTTGRQTGGTETRGRSRSGTRGFPVHRLEFSPVIASYTQERERLSDSRSQGPPVSPGEVVWKLKGDDRRSKHSEVSQQSPHHVIMNNINVNVCHHHGFPHNFST